MLFCRIHPCLLSSHLPDRISHMWFQRPQNGSWRELERPREEDNCDLIGIVTASTRKMIYFKKERDLLSKRAGKRTNGNTDICFCDLILTQLALQVSSNPYGSQRTFFRQDQLRVKHLEPCLFPLTVFPEYCFPKHQTNGFAQKW